MAACTLLAGLLFAAPAAGQASGATTERIAGDGRIATAAAIAERSFPDGADTVYLARADALADALAAGTLVDGPVLLVPSCDGVPADVTTQIDRLDPDLVVALGGTTAICDDTLATAADGRPVDRLAGATRQATSIAIAGRAFPDGAATAYVANAADSPDAVAGGALIDGPILLLPPDGTTGELAAELDRLDPDRVIALGGTAAVTDAQLAAVAAGRPTDRLAGDTRFATAAAIATAAFPDGSPVAYLARADVFADAVAAGSLADGPVLLVPQCDGLPPATATWLAEVDPGSVIALGGTAAICEDTLTAAAGTPEAPPQPTPTPSTPPPPGDGLPPVPTTGSLFYTWNGTMTRYDIPTAFQTSLFYDLVGSYTLPWDFAEFVWYDTDIVDDESAVTVHDTETGVITEQILLPFYLQDTPQLAPGRTYLAALADHLQDDGSNTISRSDLVVFDREGTVISTVPLVRSFAFTPQGDLLITTEQTDPPSIGVVDATSLTGDGPPAYRQLKEYANWDNLPEDLAVSPDSSRAVYTFLDHLYVLPLDGSADHRQVTTSNFAEYEAGFSPDGRHLVLTFNELPTSGRTGLVHIIPADLAEPIRLAPGGSTNPQDPYHPYPIQVADETGDPLAASGRAGIFWRP